MASISARASRAYDLGISSRCAQDFNSALLATASLRSRKRCCRSALLRVSVGFLRAKRIAQEEREQLADTFFSAPSEIHEELNGIKDEALRLHQIDQGIATERDPWARQH
jgi:hypothetical protein